jgi:uncharacterized protein YcgI (DUF1989 family)
MVDRIHGVNQANNMAFGQYGSIFIDDTGQHTGPYVAVTALADAVVDVSDCTSITDSMEDGDADFTIPKGVTIYGRFAVFSLDSGGPVIAYKG